MKVLTLYKSLLRVSQDLPSYNFRMYALRKIRSSFRDNMQLKGHEIKNKIVIGEKNLQLMKRQIVVANLYSPDKLIIEQV